jgi:hypothetical protein
VSFRDGELIHMTCYRVESQATRRRTDSIYKGHIVRVFCYPLMGGWRPAAWVERPGRFSSTRLGPMKLCASAEEALAVALKMATAWVDDASPARVQPVDICGEDFLRGHS